MYSFLLPVVALLALGASANPTPRSATCLCAEEAAKVAENFKDLINLPFSVSLARAALTKDFVDYSDSVNELINGGCPNGPAPLTTATFTGRHAFIQGQSGQNPIP